MRTPRIRSRLAATAAVVALVAGVFVLTPSAGAVQDTTTSRLFGANRFSTAVAVAEAGWPNGASDVVLATGIDYPDALAAAGLAGAIDAPILLTTRDNIPTVTAAAIEDLDPDTVHIVGGDAAVSPDVEEALDDAGYTTPRYFGANRFETAAAVGEAIDDTEDLADPDSGIGETNNGRTALVTSGLNFPDAVAASQLAAGGRFPILLADAVSVPQATLDALDDLAIEHVVVLGGESAVSDRAVDDMEDAGYTTQRVSGSTRYGTSVAVLDFATAALGIGGDTLYLATGEAFADALGGGVLAAKDEAPMLLTARSVVVPDTEGYVLENASAVDEVIAFGGDGAVKDEVLDEIADLAVLDSNQVYDVTPANDEVKDESSNALNDAGRREFTVTGLEPSTTFDIAIVNTDVVLSGEQVRFSAFTLSDEASTSIETINGANSPNTAGSGNERARAEGTSNASGQLTFTVDATDPDDIIPVVWLDENSDNTLNLTNGLPDEPFGVGGRTSWLPPEAADGVYAGTNTSPDPDADFNRVTVTSVNYSKNYFIAGGNTFFYSGSDVFQGYKPPNGDRGAAGGVTLTGDEADFEGMLTANDILEIEYFSGSLSQFTVIQDRLRDIDDVAAEVTSINAGSERVRITFVDTDQPDAEFEIYLGDQTIPAANDDNLLTPVPNSFSRSGGTVRLDVDVPASTPAGGYEFTVNPVGGYTETFDEPDGDLAPDNYLTNEVMLGVPFVLMDEGFNVRLNANISSASQGDIWWLHFTRSMKVGSNPSLTLDLDGDLGTTSDRKTYGTGDATFAADGAIVSVTLKDIAADKRFNYGVDATITSLSGLSDLGGSTAYTRLDNVLDHDGPELLPQSSTCDEGDTSCTIRFNEPVDPDTAESNGNYGFVRSQDNTAPPNNIGNVSLGDDEMTITITFTNQATGLEADAEISPAPGGGLINGVEDAGGTRSSQGLFDFVFPLPVGSLNS